MILGMQWTRVDICCKFMHLLASISNPKDRVCIKQLQISGLGGDDPGYAVERGETTMVLLKTDTLPSV